MKAYRLIICIFLLMLSVFAVSQSATLDKARATSLVTQVLTEKNLQLQSSDDAGTWFKSQPFPFTNSGNVHYSACFYFKVVDNSIQVSLSDLKFQNGLKAFIKPSSREQQEITNPVSVRINGLLNSAVQSTATPASNGNIRDNGNNPDNLDKIEVAGISLNMSPDEARRSILKQHPSASDTKLEPQISTEYFSQPMGPVGELFEIEPYVMRKDGAAYAGSGDMQLGEAVEIVYAPGANNLLGIFRFKSYRTDSLPTFDSTVKALVQKYGKTDIADVNEERLNNALSWVARADVQRPSPSGYVTYKPGGCFRPGFAIGDHLLYETTVENRYLGASDAEQHREFIQDSFLGVFNTLAKDQRAYSKCGTVFLTYLVRAPNSDYVSAITEKIVDFDRANSELVPVVNAFYTQSEDARKKKLTKDSSSAPTF